MKKPGSTNYVSIGKELKRLRIEKGLSQVEVADRVGINRSTITAYENGRIMPSPDKLHDMARLYGVDDQVLFSLTSNEVKSEESELSPKLEADTIDFLECYRKMPYEQQNAIYDLIKDLYMEGLKK